MITVARYHSVLGDMNIAADQDGLIGVWFDDQKDRNEWLLQQDVVVGSNRVIEDTILWLDRYFSKQIPDVDIRYHFRGSLFQRAVLECVEEIPYGCVKTYKDIKESVCHKLGVTKMSYQAIGHAIATNPFLILIPCHRVIGSDGKLHGYAGGLHRKQWLLENEHHL